MAPGNSIWDWLISPVANNDTSDNAINWRELQDPATVNNSARQMMGRVAEMLSDFACVPVSVTTGSAIALTVSSAFAANRAGLKVGFRLDVANGASPTLAVNGLAALPLLNSDGTVPVTGSLVAGQAIEAVSTSTAWVMLGTTNYQSGRMGGWSALTAAATTNLGSVATGGVNITGTGVTITSFGSGANLVKFVTFAFAGNIIQYNASSLILPGGVNITTGAGDMAEFVSDSSGNWQCISYQRQNGAPIGPTNYGVIGGRLTFVTQVPVLNAAVTAATAHFWTPYKGEAIPIFNGSQMVIYDMGGELTQLATDTTKSPAAVVASSNYDIFGWIDGTTPRATRGPAWTSATARGSGAGTTQLQIQNGILLNANAITNGPPALRGTYLGTIRSNASSTFDWKPGGSGSGGSAGVLSIWNYFNRIAMSARCVDSGATYTYASGTIRQARASAANQISLILGLQEDSVMASYSQSGSVPASSDMLVGIGLDSTSANIAAVAAGAGGSATDAAGTASASLSSGTVGLGWHTLSANEASNGAGSITFNLTTGNPGGQLNVIALM
jgi:hypothetical protein